MWFFLVVVLGIVALGIWMWKRPDPVERDQARAEQHDLWLEQVDAQMAHALRLLESNPPNFGRAYELFEDLAKNYQLAQAYVYMGLMHLRGQGREVSPDHATGYLEKAFRLGSEDAAYQLGQMFEQQNDVEKAQYWYRHAVAKGSLEAQYRLNDMTSEDSLQSVEQRIQLLKNNADEGHSSSQYQLAQHYFKTDDSIAGLHYLFRAASQDHAAAHQQLFELYSQGQYLEANPNKALEHLKHAIHLGEHSALYVYYAAVLRGDIDVDQRQRIYHDLLKKGKEQKQAAAKALLGDAHFHGWYLDRNETLGYRFWLEAAADHDVHALKQLAALYVEGHDLVGQDQTEKALEYYALADQIAADADTKIGMALCYLQGIGVAQDVTRARSMLSEAAAQYWRYSVTNEADLYHMIGRHYARESYPRASQDKARAYFHRAAELGHAEAAWQLYQLELKAQLNATSTAVNTLKHAADLGHVIAQRELGKRYLRGQGVEQDITTAVDYLQYAAQQQDAAAKTLLAEMYEKGMGGEINLAQAIEYYKKAAEQLDADALSHLGRLYTKGEGVERDLVQAQQLLEKAAWMGHLDAQAQLENIHAYLHLKAPEF